MGEPNITASAIINFAESLEDKSSKFYSALAENFDEQKETFLAFAKESEKNKTLIVRTYRETISDALEACFIRDLNINNYIAEAALAEGMSYPDALKMAIQLEEKASKFYSDAAERSESLLATIPLIFRRVAKRRNDRKLRLKSLLESLK